MQFALLLQTCSLENYAIDFKTPYTHFEIIFDIALQKQLYFQFRPMWKSFYSLQCFRLTVYGAEGMDGCLGPTAAWCWGTGSLSVWGTLLLLCPTHYTIDLRLPHVRCTNAAQVNTDSRSALWTQCLTAFHMQTLICLAALSKHDFLWK